MAEQSEIPDWLRELRPEGVDAGEPSPEPLSGIGEASAPPPAFVGAEEVAGGEELEETSSGVTAMFSSLRRKADVAQPEVERRGSLQRSAIFRLVRRLKPQQRFLLALMLFLNVSVAGCLILIALQRIYFGPR